MLFSPDTISSQEQFVVLYLNRANKVIGSYQLSKGGITGTIADVRLILSVALKTLATGLILAHNHPSGNLNLLKLIGRLQTKSDRQQNSWTLN
jgi:DNA repair protein RadC